MTWVRAAYLCLASTICAVALAEQAHAEITIGRPHSCARWESANAGVEGITTVTFHITMEGRVTAPSVTASSGNAQQDAAAFQCVQSWLYRPTVKDGVPVETPWIADIAWNPTIPPSLTERLGECAKALRARLSDFTVVDGVTGFAITYEQFKVAAVVITHSSGDATLDMAAADCVKSDPEPRETVVINNRFHLLGSDTFPARIVWMRTGK